MIASFVPHFVPHRRESSSELFGRLVLEQAVLQQEAYQPGPRHSESPLVWAPDAIVVAPPGAGSGDEAGSVSDFGAAIIAVEKARQEQDSPNPVAPDRVSAWAHDAVLAPQWFLAGSNVSLP